MGVQSTKTVISLKGGKIERRLYYWLPI